MTMTTISIPDVAVDSEGRATHRHVASHHQGNGEVTLCGAYIHYSKWNGEAPDAEPCPTCERLDA